jgi:hypothetical protein
MQATLAVEGDGAAAAMRSLQTWLQTKEELRGQVRPVVRTPQPGEMGSVVEALTFAAEASEVATAIASVVIAWIRRQAGKVSVRVTRPDGAEMTVTADHVRGLTPEEIRSMVTQLKTILNGSGVGE